jgi:hypothetical protein
MDGGHLEAEGLSITNSPVGLDLKRGATVDGKDITFLPGKTKRKRS